MKPVLNDDYDDEQDESLTPDDVDDGGDIDISSTDSDDGDDNGDEGSGEGKKLSEAERKKADEIAEAESLTVTAKKGQRQQLEDELARFLAQGGRIVEVPPDADAHD